MGKKLSLVIPAKDEEKSIKPLYQEIISNKKLSKYDLEVIFIDDGSVDSTFDEISKIHRKDNRVIGIRLRGNQGKSIALQNGFDYASGETIVTLDADLQDDPNEVPKLLDKLSEGYDIVSGWKKVRHDPLSKTLPSKIGNFSTRLLTGIKIHDLNCGLKVYTKEAAKSLTLYGELYKYIPVLAERKNFRVTEVIIKHRPRKFGHSKFGWERNIKGFLDMLTVMFLTGYAHKPGHFFGTFGIIFFFCGFVIGLYITYLRITTGSIQFRHPLLYLGMLLMILGVQLVTTGLLAEMITSAVGKKNDRKNQILETLE